MERVDIFGGALPSGPGDRRCIARCDGGFVACMSSTRRRSGALSLFLFLARLLLLFLFFYLVSRILIFSPPSFSSLPVGPRLAPRSIYIYPKMERLDENGSEDDGSDDDDRLVG